jgi:enoyl-CoA hydratase
MIGIQRAVELVMTGALLDARTAAAWGLVSRVVPDDELPAAGAQFAAGVAAKSPLAVANAKEVMNHIWAENLSVSAGLQVEKERNAYYCLTAQDATEGLLAFRDKRAPRFTGT